jgi:hypothetical protein
MSRCTLLLGLVAWVLVAGCADETPAPGFIAYPVPYEIRTQVTAGAAPVAVVEHNEHETGGAAVDLSRARRVLLLQGRKLDRPAEVVGVVDAHEPSGREDVAFQRLQERAAALGADAVVGIDFHHGEGAGEPLHLSGLAVRFLDRAP